MEKLSLTADAPGYLKIWIIEEELLDFVKVLETKYYSMDFVLWFCFRALKDISIESGWKSKATFYKKDNALSIDLIMPESEFVPFKKDINMQRKIMGKYFYPFFSETIKKYSKKLPTLKPIADELILDMKKFLIEIHWLDS